MGLYDRDYTQADFQPGRRYAPRMHFGFPRWTPVVKFLIALNVVIFVAEILILPSNLYVETDHGPAAVTILQKWLSVFPVSITWSLQVWRIVTYQFLHGGFRHIFWNMLLLYFFGTLLEGLWGSKRFIIFYLTCGAMGGILYPILVHVGWLTEGYLIGASGGILGILAACAVISPNMRLFIFVIFPIRMVVLALIIAGISILTLLRPDRLGNAGGQAAHFAGMAAGAAYAFLRSRSGGLKSRIQAGAWEKKVRAQGNLQAQLDKILEKVHTQGIQSLSRKEKKTLKQATEAEQQRKRS